MSKTRIVLVTLAVAAIAALGTRYWLLQRQQELPDGLVSSNGRIEADQIDVAAKLGGRVRAVSVREGDLVSPGQVVARVDDAELQALRAKYLADLAGQEASVLEAKAMVLQRRAELALKEADLQRSLQLVKTGAVSQQNRDRAQSERDAAMAILEATEKNVIARERAIEAAKALVDQVDTQIADTVLQMPVQGRVLYRLANPGEVVGAGGKILTIVDLSEIYMEIYLPADQAIRVAVGSQARIQLDGIDFAVPARVSFVSPEAQFTPKQVETRSERDKLVFRVKLRVPPSLVARHIEQVKTGARGTGYVRLGPNPPDWPAALQKRSPGDPLEAVD